MTKRTQLTFFKNTPLIDFQNTIHFDSNSDRDDFFLNGNHYPKVESTHNNFNWIRDRSSIDVDIPYEEFMGVNYCTFISEFEPGTRYYAYVVNYEYINPGNTRVYLLIDGIMTFTQDTVLQTLPNLTIHRQHLTFFEYNKREMQLKNNDDILKTHTKRYFYTRSMVFAHNNFKVVFQCSADLEADFGTVDKPLFKTSKGTTYDGITSPVNLYVVDFTEFNTFMESLAPYPWITQNIKKVLMIPNAFINDADLQEIGEIDGGFKNLKVLRRGGRSEAPVIGSQINLSPVELHMLFGFDVLEEKHLLRNEYVTIEVYSWDGQRIMVDPGQLHNEIGLKFNGMSVIGYANKVAFYLEGYKTSDKEKQGSFLNDAIIFSNFDEIPILVDNYNLALANSANQRELAESKLLTNRVKNVFDSNAQLKDRFMDAASIVSNFSVSSLFGKFTDEYEFYRNQKAEQADLALQAPTITSQTTGNLFQVANALFGLTVKFSKPEASEMDKIRKYYQSFGYQVNEENDYLSHIHSMTIANYLQFKGSWSIPNVPVAIVEMMKAQFENGVRLWHNNGTANPMTQNLMDNEIRF